MNKHKRYWRDEDNVVHILRNPEARRPYTGCRVQVSKRLRSADVIIKDAPTCIACIAWKPNKNYVSLQPL